MVLRFKDISLMDIATICMKEMKKKANCRTWMNPRNKCPGSIAAEVDVDGRKEEWLIMFKNETHNHPTELSLGGGHLFRGAIRDPLSGRSYVIKL